MTIDPAIQAPDPDFEARVRDSFARQAYHHLIGARLVAVAPGACEIRVPFRADLTQQHGYFHGGVSGAIADSAAGYAAFTTMPADASVLTVEFKINLLAPARGDELISRARVRRAGRTLVIVQSDVHARTAGTEKLIATCLATMMCLHGQSDDPARQATGSG